MSKAHHASRGALGGRRRSRRVVAWLAMTALVLPAFLAVVVNGPALAAPASVLGDIVLCTPDGLRTIKAAEVPAEDSSPGTPVSPLCLVCLVLGGPGAPPPTAPAIARVDFGVTALVLPSPTTRASTFGPEVPPPARAPPAA